MFEDIFRYCKRFVTTPSSSEEPLLPPLRNSLRRSVPWSSSNTFKPLSLRIVPFSILQPWKFPFGLVPVTGILLFINNYFNLSKRSIYPNHPSSLSDSSFFSFFLLPELFTLTEKSVSFTKFTASKFLIN